jgi:hypothetical protein
VVPSLANRCLSHWRNSPRELTLTEIADMTGGWSTPPPTGCRSSTGRRAGVPIQW